MSFLFIFNQPKQVTWPRLTSVRHVPERSVPELGIWVRNRNIYHEVMYLYLYQYLYLLCFPDVFN